jgi:ABC-type sulfate transport system substrate-binding protein
MKASLKRLDHAHDELAWAVWHTAFLSTYYPQNSSDFTSLDRLLSRKAEPKKLDWEQSLSMFESWVKGTTLQ